MTVLLRTVVFVAGLALAAMWLWAAAGKLLHAEPAYELVSTLVDTRPLAQAVVVLVVAVEVALGLAILLRLVRGLLSSAVLLGAFTAFLAAVHSQGGEALPCGCFGTVDVSVRESVLHNVWILVAILAVFALDLALRRRDRAAAESAGTA